MFGLIAWRIAYEPAWLAWQILTAMAFAILTPLACLTGAVLLMAFAGRWLDAVTRRHQERSSIANFKDVWPIYALYLLVLGVSWAATPLFDVMWLSTEVKVLITGAVVIAFLRMVQLQVQQVSRLDTDWPPTITPDTLTFRRAATRLHELLTTDQQEQPDHTRQRQAESVLHALAEVRAVLTDRAHLNWRQWLTGGQPNDPLPSVIAGTLVTVTVLDCAGLVFRLWQGATTRSILLILAVLGAALALATAALTASFHTHRRHNRQLADELREWDKVLRPLVYPDRMEYASAPSDRIPGRLVSPASRSHRRDVSPSQPELSPIRKHGLFGLVYGSAAQILVAVLVAAISPFSGKPTYPIDDTDTHESNSQTMTSATTTSDEPSSGTINVDVSDYLNRPVAYAVEKLTDAGLVVNVKTSGGETPEDLNECVFVDVSPSGPTAVGSEVNICCEPRTG